MNRLLAGMVFFGVMLSQPRARASSLEPKIAEKKISLRAGASSVQAEVFERTDDRPKPVILVLHGAGGTLFDGPEMRRVAQHLAEAGNAVYLVHYFDRTGTIFARDATMQKNFEGWLATVRDSVPAIQNLRHDTAPVGIFGYSLGGFLGLAAASDNPRVAALVEHAGGIWNGKMERIGKMPPVLMVHGKRDARVPFEKYAAPLVPILRKRAASLETHFFADEAHVFSSAALAEVREDAARFFRRKLTRRDRLALRSEQR